MKPKLRKIGSIFTATLVACALFLTGTFAWQSISQEALNEKAGDSNPGGRLHDDFDGTNKDVYVENFTDEETGVPIFARVRLQEYMEMGEDAGKNKEAPSRNVTVIGKKEANIKEMKTWHVHKEGYVASETNTGGTNPDTVLHDYWTLEWGGSTTYMPTFNKNKDSLEADINGTLAGKEGDSSNPYSDYKTYTAEQQETGEAIYSKEPEEKKPETHTAKETEVGSVISMEEWKAKGSEAGKYWVYDTDGWAYWADAIMPQTATGLFLSGVKMQRQPDENWYYAINVVGQFATSGDWGDEAQKTGFYEDGISKDGLLVLNTAAKRLPSIAHIQPKNGYKQYARAGETITLAVDLDIKNPTGGKSENHVVWTCEPKTPALSGNTFTPNNTMVGQTFKLTATSNIDSTKTTSIDMYVYPSEAIGVVKGELDGKTYVNFGDNTYKVIKETGELGDFICAGIDETIGTNDDRTDVVVLVQPNADYGIKFLGPNIGESYWAMGDDEKLGTIDDIKVVGSPEWPNNITNQLADNVTITTNGNTKDAKLGKRIQLNADVTLKGNSIAVQDVKWSVSGNAQEGTKISDKGVLTVDPNETVGATLTVYAESKEMKGLKSMITLTVVPLEYSDLPYVEAGSTTTVRIDGIDWYVLVKDNGKALILAKDVVGQQVFSTYNVTDASWYRSSIHSYLNGIGSGDFLANKPTLKQHLVETKITTRKVDGTGVAWDETTDKVFLLSEADLFGKYNNTITTEAKDYTYGNSVIVSKNEIRKSTSPYWLRSSSSKDYGRYVDSGGTSSSTISPKMTAGVRPALWINLS